MPRRSRTPTPKAAKFKQGDRVYSITDDQQDLVILEIKDGIATCKPPYRTQIACKLENLRPWKFRFTVGDWFRVGEGKSLHYVAEVNHDPTLVNNQVWGDLGWLPHPCCDDEHMDWVGETSILNRVGDPDWAELREQDRIALIRPDQPARLGVIQQIDYSTLRAEVAWDEPLAEGEGSTDLTQLYLWGYKWKLGDRIIQDGNKPEWAQKDRMSALISHGTILDVRLYCGTLTPWVKWETGVEAGTESWGIVSEFCAWNNEPEPEPLPPEEPPMTAEQVIEEMDRAMQAAQSKEAIAVYTPNFLTQAEADRLFEVSKALDWQHNQFRIYGKTMPLPRLEIIFGDAGCFYKYGNVLLEPQPWIPELEQLRAKVEQATGYKYQIVIGNLYRNGSDHIGWHSDDSKEMGSDPAIASISLGATRAFETRQKGNKESERFELNHGDLVFMPTGFQASHQHRICKTNKPTDIRINWTFRPHIAANTHKLDLAPTNALEQLASQINALHADCEQAKQVAQSAEQSALQHAIRAGELLLEAKKQAGHGHWETWREANLKLPSSTATLYQRCFERKAELEGVTTLREAQKLLKKPTEQKQLAATPAATPQTKSATQPHPVADLPEPETFEQAYPAETASFVDELKAEAEAIEAEQPQIVGIDHDDGLIVVNQEYPGGVRSSRLTLAEAACEVSNSLVDAVKDLLSSCSAEELADISEWLLDEEARRKGYANYEAFADAATVKFFEKEAS